MNTSNRTTNSKDSQSINLLDLLMFLLSRWQWRNVPVGALQAAGIIKRFVPKT